MHKHRARWMSDAEPFFGPVRSDGRANPKSYGCVSYIQRCSCGATRRVNSNNMNREYGYWQDGQEGEE